MISFWKIFMTFICRKEDRMNFVFNNHIFHVIVEQHSTILNLIIFPYQLKQEILCCRILDDSPCMLVWNENAERSRDLSQRFPCSRLIHTGSRARYYHAYVSCVMCYPTITEAKVATADLWLVTRNYTTILSIV